MTNGYRSEVQVGIIMKMNKKEGERKILNVVIKDITFDESYYLKLSKEQVRLLEWLAEKEMLPDIRIEIFEGYDFKEI